MTETEEQIKAIEKEIRETPYHKGTEHHIGKLRARLARLKDRQIESQVISKGGGGGGYSVKKQGDATLILIGPPSAGKSTLINKLTNAKSKIAPYAFTTVSVIPGMMQYRNTNIQILDVPGLIEGAEEGKGRGREVLSVARGADLILLITDVQRLHWYDRIEKILYKNGVRLNKVKPNVKIDKKLKGGLVVHTNIKQPFTKDDVKEVASEFGIKNAEIAIYEHLDFERLADAFSRNRVYAPVIHVANKIDQINEHKLKSYLTEVGETRDSVVGISAENDLNLENLKELIWARLNFVRIYLVRKDEEPSTNNPIIVKGGVTLAQVATQIGTDFAENKKRARIWESGAKFPGQEVSLQTTVLDGMQVRFV